MNILVALAALPALLLLYFIFKQDKIEKEPLSLLFRLLLGGALVIIPVFVVELALGSLLSMALNEYGLPYIILENFIVVALVEESGKFIILRRTWKRPEFGYLFDAMVYAVAVSMGFALLENILYVVGEGTISLAVTRGLLSVPLHAIAGIFMGFFFGLAKQASLQGNSVRTKSYLWLSVLVPTLLHGFYDFCLSVESGFVTIIFFAFVITLYIVAFIRVRKSSKSDVPLYAQDVSHENE